MRKQHWEPLLGCGLICAMALACQAASGPKHGVGGNPSTGSVGGNSGAGSVGSGGTTALPSDALTLDGVTAHVDGRSGDRVRLKISGQQVVGRLASAAVTPLNSKGERINFFDMDYSGSYDSPTGYFVPPTMPKDATFTFDLLIPLTTELQDWKKAEVFLVDRKDAISNTITVDVEVQPVRTKGSTCDITVQADRCADGLECDASTSTCVTHQRPSLSQVGYFTTTNGPLLIASGTDALDDLVKMRINFFDGTGAPVNINITNDTTNPVLVSSFDEIGGFGLFDGTFVFRINPAPMFTETVKKVELVPIDAQAKQGQPLSGTLTPQPSKGSGAACDYLGFNYCSGNSVCVPGVLGAANACLPITAAQGAVCKSVPVLEPGNEKALVTGYAAGSSLWDPPSNCASETALHNPEFVAKMHLAQDTPAVTLSTVRRETQIDTVLYVATVCSPSESQIIGCNDDSTQGSALSSLTLVNLKAGDYYVIVDSRTGAEGAIGLKVSVP